MAHFLSALWIALALLLLVCASASATNTTLHPRRLLFGRHELPPGDTIVVDTLAHSGSPNAALDIPYRIFDSLLAVFFDLYSPTARCEATSVFLGECSCPSGHAHCTVTLSPNSLRPTLALIAFVLSVISGPVSRSPSFFHLCVLTLLVVMLVVYIFSRTFNLLGLTRSTSNALGVVVTLLGWFSLSDFFSTFWSLLTERHDPFLGVAYTMWFVAGVVLALTFGHLAVSSLFPYTPERAVTVRVTLKLLVFLLIMGVFQGHHWIGMLVALTTLLLLSEPILAAIWALVQFLWEKLVAFLGRPRPPPLLTREQYEEQGRVCTADAMSDMLLSLRGKSALELTRILRNLSGPARDAMLAFVDTGSTAAALDPRTRSSGGADTTPNGPAAHVVESDDDLFEASESEETDAFPAAAAAQLRRGSPAAPSAAAKDTRAAGRPDSAASSATAGRRNPGQGSSASPAPRLLPRDTFDAACRPAADKNTLNGGDSSQKWPEYHLSPPNWSLPRPASTATPSVGGPRAHDTQGVRPPALARVQGHSAATGSPAGNSSPMSVNSSPNW